MQKQYRRHLFYIVIVLTALALSGCASSGCAYKAPEEAAAARTPASLHTPSQRLYIVFSIFLTRTNAGLGW